MVNIVKSDYFVGSRIQRVSWRSLAAAKGSRAGGEKFCPKCDKNPDFPYNHPVGDEDFQVRMERMPAGKHTGAPTPATASFWSQTQGLTRPFWVANMMEMMERLAYYSVRVVIPIYIAQADEIGGLHFTQGARCQCLRELWALGFGLWALGTAAVVCRAYGEAAGGFAG